MSERQNQDALLVVTPQTGASVSNVDQNQEALMVLTHQTSANASHVLQNQEALLLLVPIIICGPIQLINGGFQDSFGNVLANGSITLELSQDAQACSRAQVCSGILITIPLDTNGNISGTPGDGLPAYALWGNDEFLPANTFYKVKAFTTQGQLGWGPQNVTVTGAGPFDCNTWTGAV